MESRAVLARNGLKFVVVVFLVSVLLLCRPMGFFFCLLDFCVLSFWILVCVLLLLV